MNAKEMAAAVKRHIAATLSKVKISETKVVIFSVITKNIGGCFYGKI